MSKRRVYFIKPVGMDGPIKIGCSQAPNRRKAALATWSPFALEIVAQLEGDFQIERRFHAKHFAAHERQEWFTATDEIKADIAAINAGTFDVTSLPEPRCLPSKAGNRTGRKWTAEEKARCRRRNGIKRAEKSSGLVCPFDFTDPRTDDFIADPVKHGITPAERKRRWSERYYAMRMETIERERKIALQRAQAILADAA